MSTISAIGKYLDQPLLTAKINKNVPLALTVGSTAVIIKKIENAPKEKRKKSDSTPQLYLPQRLFLR